MLFVRVNEYTILFYFITVPCSTGTYYNGGTICADCPLGMYQDDEAAVTCKPCPNGTYTDSQGAVSIKKCLGMLLIFTYGYYLLLIFSLEGVLNSIHISDR